MKRVDPVKSLESARRTFALESTAVAELADKLDAQFVSACELMIAVQGRVIVTGMGK